MPIPFLNSITLNKNEIQEFKVYNLTPDPTLTSAGDYGYMWLNTSDSPKTLKWWDGTSIRSIVDSGNTSTLTVGTANDLSGGVAGSLPYQQGVGDTTFLGIGTADQVLTVNSGATAPQWLSQSSLSVGSATNKTGGNLGDILVQSGSGTTGFLNVGTAGQVITSNGASPQYVNQSTLSVGSATTAGSVTNSLTAGTYLTSGGTYNGSVARTFAVDATDANTASKVVARDASGNFAAGTITATRVTGLSAPTAGSDAANRDYVDGVAQGLDVKASCLVATTVDITLASPGAVTIDGIYSATDFTAGTTRILVKDQSAPAENGIYIWQGPSSAMTRSSDANTWDELVGAFTFVERGTANADSGWVCTVNAGGTLGTTAVTWVKFSQAGSYTAGNGIVQSGTSFNFAQSSAYTAGQIPFASSTTAMGFNANLHWDNSNNRLGIGTATPGYTLDVNGNLSLSGVSGGSRYILLGAETSSYTGSLIIQAGAGSAAYGGGIVLYGHSHATYPGGVWIGRSGSATGPIMFGDYGTGPGNKFLQLDTGGVCTWYDGAGGTRMTLNATGLGIGVSPNHPLTVNGTIRLSGGNGTKVTWASDASSQFIQYSTAIDGLIVDGYDTVQLQTRATPRVTVNSSGNVGIGTTTPAYKLDVNGALNVAGGVIHRIGTVPFVATSAGYTYYYGNSNGIIWRNAADTTSQMALDASGHLGLGVTPGTWASGWVSLSIKDKANNLSANGGSYFEINQNAYYNGGFKYVNANPASRYEMGAGSHYWFTAATGSADALIAGGSWSSAMTLTAGGVLLLGAASAASSETLRVYNTTNSRLIVDQASNGLVLGADASGAFFDTTGSNRLAFFVGGTQRLSIKTTGQVNFVGQASDPAGAAGDVVYNSTSNRLKYHNGTAWVDSGTRKVSVVGGAGTGTYIDATHNFNTKTVSVTVLRTTDNVVVYTDVAMTNDNTVRVTFASSVTLADYTVTVIG